MHKKAAWLLLAPELRKLWPEKLGFEMVPYMVISFVSIEWYFLDGHKWWLYKDIESYSVFNYMKLRQQGMGSEMESKQM